MEMSRATFFTAPSSILNFVSSSLNFSSTNCSSSPKNLTTLESPHLRSHLNKNLTICHAIKYIHKLELKMFEQTYTASKPPSACTAITLSPLGCDTVVSSAAACSVRTTAHASPYHTLSMVMIQQFFVFCPGWPWRLTFDLEIQTRLSKAPDTSPLWIWRKSVQRFPRYFIHKETKKSQTWLKKNLTCVR